MSFGGTNSLYHVDCDVGHLACADLGTLDALARASLNVRRHGERLYVVNAPRALQELLRFAGRGGVLLGRDGRKSEEREQPLGVEERREADDLPV